MENCYRCKESYHNSITLSCKHKLCSRCILRQILKKNLLELPDKDSIIFNCKCKKGNIDLNLIKIGEIVNTNLEEANIQCEKHNIEVIKFCKECKKNMCEKCFEGHEQLFSDHHIVDVTDTNTKNLVNTICNTHNKEYSYYCKTCKISLCNACIHDKDIISIHKDHEIESYKSILSTINDNTNRLQFNSYETFIEYMTKMEGEFDNNYHDNFNKSTKSLENIINTLTKTFDDFKVKMEIKFAKKDLVMTIIKKIYQVYYDDIKKVKNGDRNISTLKFLSRDYSEFSDISFRSDLDLIINKLEKIRNILEKEDISNAIRISYAYFSKRELKLTTKIKDNFKDQVTDIIELKDGRLAISCDDNLIKIFDKRGNNIYDLKGHVGGVRSLCQIKEGKLASGSADKTIRIWDLKQNKTIEILKEHSNAVIALNILLNDKLASCSLREIIIYNEKLKAQYILKDHSNWVRNIIQIDKGRSCSCSDDGTIKIYDKHFRVLNSFKDHDMAVLSICLLRDGRLVTGDRSGKMIVWNKNLTYTKELKQHSAGILSIKQLKDGRICSSSADKTVKIWDIDFRNLYVFKEHTGYVNCLCIIKDGGLVSGGADGIVNIWT